MFDRSINQLTTHSHLCKHAVEKLYFLLYLFSSSLWPSLNVPTELVYDCRTVSDISKTIQHTESLKQHFPHDSQLFYPLCRSLVHSRTLQSVLLKLHMTFSLRHGPAVNGLHSFSSRLMTVRMKGWLLKWSQNSWDCLNSYFHLFLLTFGGFLEGCDKYLFI